MVNPKQTGRTQNTSETEHLITEINEDEEIHTENAKSQQTEHQDIDIEEDGVTASEKNGGGGDGDGDIHSVDIHCEVIAIEVKTINIIVICMYRSPSGDPGIFLQKLNHILNLLLKTHKPIFIYEDFNINIKDNCNLTNEFCDTVSSFGCELLVYESTRITQNSETCIDNCITNVRKASEITLVNCYMSDHIGLKNKYTLDSEFKMKGETCIIGFRPMSDEAIKKCIYLLKKYKWDHLEALHDIDNIFEIFFDILLKTIDECSPKKTKT
ncbi:hypothetical protein JTB14_013042 [Gonioctena quinquepunctata]|nr:hypothetical protein JTB14_013042 [Gonioctena quinquepunctata]